MFPHILLLLLPLLVQASQLDIHHRILDPALPTPDFTLKATIDTSGSLFHVDPLPNHSKSSSPASLYQVALQHNGNWLISSVKACHLDSATSDKIILHLASDQEPYNIDYFLSPVPQDSNCPDLGARSRIIQSNTSILLHRPSLPPLPELRLPPPLTPTGQVAQPEQEKSFIEKYWMYMVGALLVMMLAPAPSEDQQPANQK